MISDELLAEQALLGNIAAFEELVNRYKSQYLLLSTGYVDNTRMLRISVRKFFYPFEKLYQFDRKSFRLGFIVLP